jgi:L-asparagine transporter-like permease
MVTDKPLSKTALAYHGVQLLTAIFLLMVTVGMVFEPQAGYFAVGVSVFMLTSWISVLLSLEIVLQRNPKVERSK